MLFMHVVPFMNILLLYYIICAELCVLPRSSHQDLVLLDFIKSINPSGYTLKICVRYVPSVF